MNNNLFYKFGNQEDISYEDTHSSKNIHYLSSFNNQKSGISHPKFPQASPSEGRTLAASPFFAGEDNNEGEIENESSEEFESLENQNEKPQQSDEDYLEQLKIIAKRYQTMNTDSDETVLKQLAVNKQNETNTNEAQTFKTISKTKQTKSHAPTNTTLHQKEQEQYQSVALSAQTKKIISKKIESGEYEPIQKRWITCQKQKADKVEEARLKKQQRDKENEERELTFKPMLNAHSRHMIEKQRTAEEVVNSLHSWNKRKQDKLFHQQFKENERASIGLTFHPQINAHSVKMVKNQEEDVVNRLYKKKEESENNLKMEYLKREQIGKNLPISSSERNQTQEAPAKNRRQDHIMIHSNLFEKQEKNSARSLTPLAKPIVTYRRNNAQESRIQGISAERATSNESKQNFQNFREIHHPIESEGEEIETSTRNINYSAIKITQNELQVALAKANITKALQSKIQEEQISQPREEYNKKLQSLFELISKAELQ